MGNTVTVEEALHLTRHGPGKWEAVGEDKWIRQFTSTLSCVLLRISANGQSLYCCAVQETRDTGDTIKTSYSSDNPYLAISGAFIRELEDLLATRKNLWRRMANAEEFIVTTK